MPGRRIFISQSRKWGKVQCLSHERHGPGRVPDPPVRNDRDRPLHHDSARRITAFSSPKSDHRQNFCKTAHLAEAFHMNYQVHHGGNSLNNLAHLS
jgi:hypothetical protein